MKNLMTIMIMPITSNKAWNNQALLKMNHSSAALRKRKEIKIKKNFTNHVKKLAINKVS